MKNKIAHLVLIALSFGILSCSNDETIDHLASTKNTEETSPKYATFSTEPTIQYIAATTLISVSDTHDCFTYQVDHILRSDTYGDTLLYSTIMHSGSGCATEGKGLATESVEGIGIYKGDYIIKDYLVQGKTIVSLWESDPKANASFVAARDKMITTFK